MGVTTALSTVSPVRASTSGPSCFLTSPYKAKEKASTREIHGSEPCSTTRRATAALASAIETRCAGRNRSCSTSEARATVTSGLMK